MNESTTTPPIIPLRELAGNSVMHLDPIQQVLLPYSHWLGSFWFALWCMTAIVLLVGVARDYLSHRT